MAGIFNSGSPELIASIPVDQITGEFHSASANPTLYAVETGAQVSDHIVLDPDTVEISWLITNVDDNFSIYGTRAATQFDKIKEALRSRELYDVVTRHYLYKDMALISINAESTSPFVGQLVGRVSFQKFNKAQTQAVTVERLSSSAKQTASKQSDAGKVEAAENAETNKSFLEQLRTGFGLEIKL